MKFFKHMLAAIAVLVLVTQNANAFFGFGEEEVETEGPFYFNGFELYGPDVLKRVVFMECTVNTLVITYEGSTQVSLRRVPRNIYFKFKFTSDGLAIKDQKDEIRWRKVNGAYGYLAKIGDNDYVGFEFVHFVGDARPYLILRNIKDGKDTDGNVYYGGQCRAHTID